MASVLAFLSLAVLLPAGGAVSGCDEAVNTAADVALPPAREEELGEKLERELKCDPEIKLYEGKKVRDYIEDLGRQAVEAAGDETPDPIKYEFNVIDAPDTINAFAMPGGEIYFYTGLLKEAETASEVMSVMAHEVAHVTERHVAEKLVATYGAQTLIQAALGEDPSAVAELAAVIVAKGSLLKYGRKQESEADDTGLRYMKKAGWDPYGFIAFFTKLQQKQGPSLPTILSSHPKPEDRIEAIKKKLDGEEFPDAKVERERHQQILQVLESGNDDPDPDFEAPMNCDEINSDAGMGDVGTD